MQVLHDHLQCRLPILIAFCTPSELPQAWAQAFQVRIFVTCMV